MVLTQPRALVLELPGQRGSRTRPAWCCWVLRCWDVGRKEEGIRTFAVTLQGISDLDILKLERLS